MKKVNVIVFIIIIILQTLIIQIGNVSAEDVTTVDTSIKLANDFMKENFNQIDFFDKTSLKGKPLYNDLAINGNAAFNNKPVFVYQTEALGSEEGSKYGNDTRRYDSNGNPRALGFSYTDCPYANPSFRIDDISYVRRWIKEPWDLPKQSQRGITKQLSPDNPSDIHKTQWLEYQPNAFASTYSVINQWIKSDYFSPSRIEEKTGNRKFFNNSIEGPLPAGLQTNPEDYIYMIQPPTYNSWGIGIAFYYYGGTGSNNMSKPNYYSYYQYFRFKPFSLLSKDLSANFDPLQLSAANGGEVLVGVNVKSTFDEELDNVPFEWKITKKSGGSVSATFVGHSNVGKGTLKIPAKGERMLYAKFIMPDSGVDIKFEINKDGNSPPEISLDNNVLNSGSAVKLAAEINTTVQFDLDYNILSRKVAFPLASKDIKAELTKDRGTWYGNAFGSLIVENKSTNIFHDYPKTKIYYVDEDNSTIIRNPEIHMSLLRRDFDNGHLVLPKPEEPKITDGYITFGGIVKRYYEYTIDDILYRPLVTTAFDSGKTTGRIRTFVYNGKKNVVPKEKFITEVVSNKSKPNSKTMYWKSEPYEFNVFRLMYEKGENNKLSTPIKVNGIYKRNFVNQNMADTSWTVLRSMKDEYSKSRSAAKKRDTNKSLLDKAVFASDKRFDSKAYPIKSGYYFNPTGTYTFTIKTETYKPNKGKTDDHEDIVNAFKNAFRYESNLVYKSKSGQAVDLLNNSVKRGSKGYKGQMAILTVNKSTGLYGEKWIQVDDDDYHRYDEEEVYFPQSIDERNGNKDDIDIKTDVVKDADGVLDIRWKNILEGYIESSTRDSFGDFKYREYVDDSGKYKKMYKVIETSTVTIKINPDNTKAYTHDTMADGDYIVKAYIDNISFKNNVAYGSLSLNGNSALDKIDIDVVGSKSDDINVN